MSCPPEEVLSAHHDGDLDESEAARIEAHLAECDSCRATHEELAALVGGLATLGEVEPARDLWPVISVRRNQGRVRGWWLWPTAALAAATAVTLFIILPHQPARDADPKLQRAYHGVVAAERTYVESIAALEAAVGDEVVATLSPAARTAVVQGLAQIDDTIQRCRRELDGVPHDLRAHRALLAAYQRKVDLLTDLVDHGSM